MRHVDVLLGRWAEWVRRGGGVASAIGYPPSTTEYRLLRSGPGGRLKAQSKVPTWFFGVAESRIHRAICRLPADERYAVILEWLWTSEQRGKRIAVVRPAEKRVRWARETGRSEKAYSRALRRAEDMLVHYLGD